MAWDKTVPTVLTIVANSAEQIKNNFTAFEAFANLEHDGPACASPGPHKPGRTTALYVNTYTNVAALATASPSSVAFDTTYRDLHYHNTNYINIGGFCPSGSKMLFYQDTAPVGWAIDNTLDDKLVYVMAPGDTAWNGSGYTALSGGSPHGTGTWTLPSHTHIDDGHAITVAEMAAHTHAATSKAASANGVNSYTTGFPGGEFSIAAAVALKVGNATYGGVNAAGATHSHGTAAAASYSAWRPGACCAIIATKY